MYKYNLTRYTLFSTSCIQDSQGNKFYPTIQTRPNKWSPKVVMLAVRSMVMEVTSVNIVNHILEQKEYCIRHLIINHAQPHTSQSN
jgi:hypothetical protein